MKTEILKLLEIEGDYKEWIYTCKNGLEFKCIIKRTPHGKHLCGYVLLTKDNKYFEVEYDDIRIHVHGGLTFSDFYESVWMVGFDCGHYNDYQPAYEYSSGVYRDMEYVINECQNLAEDFSKHSKELERNKKIDDIFKNQTND